MKLPISLFVLLLYLFSYSANAQIWNKIKKAAKRGAERVIQDRTEKDAEDATNDIYDAIGGTDNENGSSENPDPSTISSNGSLEEDQNLEENGENQVGFTRGSKIIFSDNFSKDAIGDFPAQWNTNKGGEVKNLNGYDEKWLKVPANSKVNIELEKALPKNFTVEMDLIMPKDLEYKMAGIAFMQSNKLKLGYLLSPKDTEGIGLYLNGHNKENEYLYGNRTIDLTWSPTGIGFSYNKRIKLAFEVNNHERFRVYANGNKIVDMPRGFKPEFANSIILQAITHGAEASKLTYFYVSNVVIAESGTDQRSQVSKELLENGSFSTSDILFSTGSDKIQSSSTTILNEIGEAITTAPSAQFLIIGHTDSDGTTSANQSLSQTRAEAVKDFLIRNFSISPSQLMCVGKGESEPVGSNDTLIGKAKNRRVEFKKL